MPIEMPCTGCGQTLRVADEHAGKLARCPQCGTVVSVPASGPHPVEASGPAAEDPLAFLESPASTNPFADRPEPSSNPYVSPQTTSAPFARYRVPHRGGTVLTVGILGLLLCAVLGPVAWSMGAADLRAIKAGQMDASGRGTTQAGMILGIIATVQLALAGLGIILALVLA